jgi:hypothetical protein
MNLVENLRSPKVAVAAFSAEIRQPASKTMQTGIIMKTMGRFRSTITTATNVTYAATIPLNSSDQ